MPKKRRKDALVSSSGVGSEIEVAEGHITINTSFSGQDAEIIKEYAEKYRCSRPAALRLLVRQISAGLTITLDPRLKERIEKLIYHPRIKEKYGFLDVKNFVEWAINTAISQLNEQLGSLRDPSVQIMLNTKEKKVAKHLLMMSQDLKYYGGVTLEELSAATKLPITDVKEILSSFELNGWVMRKREYDTYLFLPKD